MSSTRHLSELEYLILGLLGDGKSSGYAIRKEMNRTKGGRWSADSGSVYRILRRLESYGYAVETARVGVKNRERTEYKLTESGFRVVDAWVQITPQRTELAYMVDSLRTRSYFLNLLPASEQIRLVRHWLVESRAFAVDIEEELSRTAFKDTLRDASYRNLHFHALARVEWLRYLLTVVKANASIKVDEDDPDQALIDSHDQEIRPGAD